MEKGKEKACTDRKVTERGERVRDEERKWVRKRGRKEEGERGRERIG